MICDWFIIHCKIGEIKFFHSLLFITPVLFLLKSLFIYLFLLSNFVFGEVSSHFIVIQREREKEVGGREYDVIWIVPTSYSEFVKN